MRTTRGCLNPPHRCGDITRPSRTARARAAVRKSVGVEYRPVGPGDEAAVAEVHVAAWRAAYRGLIPDSYLDRLSVSARTESWRNLIDRVDPPRRGAVVAIDESQVLGFVHFGPSRDDDAGPALGEINAMYVHPDHWGEGVGRGLMERAVANLREAGFTSATLWVLEANERARTFYENGGWRVDGATKDEEREDVTLREVRYRTTMTGVAEVRSD